MSSEFIKIPELNMILRKDIINFISIVQREDEEWYLRMSIEDNNLKDIKCGTKIEALSLLNKLDREIIWKHSKEYKDIENKLLENGYCIISSLHGLESYIRNFSIICTVWFIVLSFLVSRLLVVSSR